MNSGNVGLLVLAFGKTRNVSLKNSVFLSEFLLNVQITLRVLRDWCGHLLDFFGKIVWKQFSQVLAVIRVVIMDVVQKIYQPIFRQHFYFAANL